MKHKTLFVVLAIVLFIYGMVWLVIPNVGLNFHGYNLTATDPASIITRYWGAAWVGLAVMLWMARNADSDSTALRAILGGGLVVAVASLIAALLDEFGGGQNKYAWINIALYVLFSVWVGYFVFKKQS